MIKGVPTVFYHTSYGLVAEANNPPCFRNHGLRFEGRQIKWQVALAANQASPVAKFWHYGIAQRPGGDK